jgi:PAS domain S-box-containing protein
MQTHPDVKRSPGLDTPEQRGVPEIGPLAEHLDVATVLKVTQAVSGEIVLEKLVEVLLRTAIEQAGAERALLILPRGSELWIQAEAKTHGDSVTVRLNETPVSTGELPNSIVRYVARTQEIVILGDASARNPYSTDEYIREQRLRSVLCLPLVKQNTLIALLYLENNIGPNIFATAKINVMRVLASAAAISLDNSRLYRELQEREGRIRRLVDANIIGILISDSEGQIIEANDAFLKMVGYTREELVSGLMSWRKMTPAEWKDVSEQGVVQVKATGACKAFEKEYYRKDGSRVPVLVGAARFEKNSIVAFAIDLTERKRAEEALQSISRDLQESKARLEEAQRITHVGYWERDIVTSRVTWSDETYRIFGLQPQERPMDLNAIMQMVHPEDREFVSRTQKEALVAGPRYDFEYRLLRPTGELRIVHAEGYVKKDVSGRPYQAFGTVQDITDRKRAEALLTGEKNLHEMIATGVPLVETLNALCLMIENQRSGTLASVLLLCPDGIHLESLAGPSLPEGWTQQIASLPIGPCAGSCGTAAYRGSPVIVSDIATDPLWEAAEHRASALSYGLRASWSYPILSSGGKVLGTFCLYYREPRSPSPSDLDLIELAAHLARVAIECKLAEEQLRRSEALLAEGQRLSHTGSWGWKPATGEMTSSKERFRIFGLDPEKTKPSFEVFWERVHPEDREKLKQTFDTATREKRDFENEYRIVTPDWVIKHVHSVGHAILNESRELVEFIGATMDITGRKRAEERAQSYNEAIRLALNAFVEELDVDRFLGHVMTGLTKQFQATSCELWLFDDPIGATSLHLVYQQGRMIAAKTVGLKTGGLATTWQPSNVGRIPRTFEIPDQASLLQPKHVELLKEQGVKTLMAVPLVLGEQNLGVVELRFREAARFTRDDLDLAQALVHHVTLALQLSRLAHRTEQMAVMEERNRLAREIHDTLAQAFAGVVLHSEALGTALGVNKSRSKKALSNIQKLARSGLEEARRSVQALRPRALESRTLSQALAQEAKRLSEDGKHSCELKQKGQVLKLSAEIQNELFRIAQEAMTNISKHAQAKSVWITLEFKDNQATLTVRDDGIGFAATDSPKPKGGYGLSTMRERALRIGGKLEIESAASGGTAIRVVASLDKKLQPSNHSI